MIEFQNVSKAYGATQALKDLNLSIQEGQIVGLIGHNGAGKSTTIKSLVSVINPTSGTIRVDGFDLASHRLRIKQKIGYVADSPDLFLRLTAQEFWDLVAASYGLNSQDYEKRLVDLLGLFDFADHLAAFQRRKNRVSISAARSTHFAERIRAQRFGAAQSENSRTDRHAFCQ